MRLLSLLIKDPLMFLALAVPLLYSVIAHEVAHGFVAGLFGDDTAKRSGRLSLNPFVHLDMMGTIALFIVGFGWAKPVPVNFGKLRNFRLGLVAVSLAGCLTNILIATAALFLLQFGWAASNPAAKNVLLIVARINIILGSFNLIPIPPLDGSKILAGFLPDNARVKFAAVEPYGFFILLALLFTGVLTPLIILSQKLILGLIYAVLNLFHFQRG